MRNRVVLFLGAGSSEPLSIPTSQEFVPQFLKIHPEFMKSWTPVEKSLRESGYKRPIDLESTMTVLDALSSEDPLDYLQEAAGPVPFYYLGSVGSGMSRAFSPPSPDLKEELQRMSQSLRLFVRERCQRPDFPGAGRIFDPMMAELGRGPWRIPELGSIGMTTRTSGGGMQIPDFDCFTTNYDLAFERYCKRNLKITVRTGFRERDGETTFRTDEITQGDAPYRVLHLHGSVEMLRTLDGRIIPTTTYPPEMRVTSGGEEIEGEAMIYPVLEKQLSRFPFPELFSAFYESVRDSPLVFFVGFSFRDEPILRLLQDASHPDQKIVIVSKTAESIANRLRPGLRSMVVGKSCRLGDSNVGEQLAGARND